MKSKKILSLTALASCVALLLVGCGGGDDADTTVTTTAITTTATAEAETTAEAAETTYINVTDENGATVTDADGAPVTEAITVTTAAPTDAEATPDSSGTDAAPTTAAEPDQGVNLPPETPTTTTVKRVEQTAPPKTTAATTPAPTSPPTTAADTRPTILDAKGRPVNLYPDDPWKYPYDVDECLRQCKAYVESLGMEWDELPSIDNGTWAGNIDSEVYTRELNDYYAEVIEGYKPQWETLFDEIKAEIDYYHNRKITGCKVIFLEDKESSVPGDYEIYIVY